MALLKVLSVFVLLLTAAHAAELAFNECTGWKDGRQICCSGVMYRDGTVSTEITTHSKHFLHGCRGGAIAIGSDSNGQATWIAKFEGKTAGSVSDVFTSSLQRTSSVVHVKATSAVATVKVNLTFGWDRGDLKKRFDQVPHAPSHPLLAAQ